MAGDLLMTFDSAETYTLNRPLVVTGCTADGCLDVDITYAGSGNYGVVDENLVLAEGPTVTTHLSPFGAPASTTVWAVDAPNTCSGDTLTFAVNEFPAFV